MEIDKIATSRSLKTENYIICFVAIPLVLLGIVLSTIPVLDRNWLARSGALVVMLGIWSGVGGIICYSILREKLTIAKANGEMRALSKYQKDPEELEQIITELNQQYIGDVENLRTKLSITIGIQEAILLLSGTLLWGLESCLNIYFNNDSI